MKGFTMARRALLAGAVLASLLLSALHTAHAAEPTVLGRISVRDPKGLSEKVVDFVDRLVAGLAPKGGAGIRALAAGIFDAPKWGGVDWRRPVTLLVLGGKAFGRKEPVLVGVFPLANAELFRAARQQAVEPPGHFRIHGQFAIASDEHAALELLPLGDFGLYTEPPEIAWDSDVYLTFYVARAIREYGADIEQAIRELQEQTKAMGGAGPLDIRGKMLQVLDPIAKVAGKQIHRATLMLTLNDESAELTGRLYAVPGSELAAFFAAQPRQTTDLAKYLPPDAVASLGGKLDMAKGRPLAEAILAVAGPALGMKPEDQEQIRKLVFATTETGEFATGVAGDAAHKGLQTISVSRIADAAKYRAGTKEWVERLSKGSLATLVQKLGLGLSLDYKPGARKHKGVTIDRFTLTMAPVPDAPPDFPIAQKPPQVTEVAAFDTLAVTVSNNPDGYFLNTTIDRIKDRKAVGLDASPAYKAARAAAPRGANLVFHASFNSLIAKLMEEAAKQQPMIGMFTRGLFKAEPAEEPITGHARFRRGRVEFAVRIPHQPFVNLAKHFRVFMEQQMQAIERGDFGPDDDVDF